MDETRITIDWQSRELRIKEVEPEPGRIRWIFQLNEFNRISGDGNMAFILAADQQVAVTIQAVDAKGNPARVDGLPTWASSDEAVLTVASDGAMGATIVATGTVGLAQVQVTVDADLGEGIRALTGVLEVEVVAAEAVAVTIVPGEPTPQA